jgi:SLBB domain
VVAPGKLPWTGGETVLDVMKNAGGLIPTADPKNIRLVRPPRGGKPARIYKIDLEAITERGEIEKNYQIFPGDRIVVGRDAVVKTTLEMDRFVSPMQTVFNAILRQSYAIRSMMMEANGGAAATITPEQREAMIKEWTDFWWKVASRPADAEIDKAFRDALMRAINPPGAVKPPEEKK